MLLSKEQLLASGQPTVKIVGVDGVGDLRIRVIDGFSRDELSKALADLGTQDGVYFSALIIASLVNENDEPIFARDDLDALRACDANWLRKVGLACVQANGLGPDAVKESEKNSEAIQSDSSGTA